MNKGERILTKNDIKVWDDDLEYIKELKLQRYELKEQIKTLELLLVESNKEVWELKEKIDKAIEYVDKKLTDFNLTYGVDNEFREEYDDLLEILGKWR